MYKNKEFRWMIIAATVVTVALSIFGYALVGAAEAKEKGICSAMAAILCLILGGVLIALFTVATKRRYEDIDALSTYLVKVLAGEEAPSILDQEEGELSLLKTNIYKATSTLNYQKELLSNDKKALADAIADISHQLKTPLTSMMVMNDLLKTESDEERRQEFLQTQSNQLDRMSWLIQTLLKLSKIDAGTITMKPEEVQASQMVADVLKPFEVMMDVKNISYSVNMSGIADDNNASAADDQTIKCDRNWTIEAIQNIVKNCIEHMEEGGKLSVAFEDTNIYKQIVVADTGCGIAKQDIPHIFERFYKGKNAGKDSVGIGLALSKTIITSQHGDIIVESTEGVGTKFFIRFYKTII
ncbi:sensor histidine kinase [Butyrivibrio proteoclasticus]|uniref:sensor histidine kinase n=1 Tax=Butyrivibrio proteoclasticus TaxID=43305 RepID=UPI0004795D67|nr:HAMP domain-containing sensor histidine kinase [Butyrivibrio proteoclasticus]